MSAGLGPRYAFYGPFETMHLNANGEIFLLKKLFFLGIADYSARYSAGLRNVLADFGPTPSFNEPAVVERLEKTLNLVYPLEKMMQHQQDRVKKLAELEKIKTKGE